MTEEPEDIEPDDGGDDAAPNADEPPEGGGDDHDHLPIAGVKSLEKLVPQFRDLLKSFAKVG